MTIPIDPSLNTVFDCFQVAWHRHPHKIYLALPGKGEFTYDQCYMLIKRLAGIIDRKPGQSQYRVLSHKDPFTFVISFWACMLCGADVLLRSDISILDEAYIKDNVALDFEDLLREMVAGKETEPAFPATPASSRAVKVYFLTSGTTGTPKLIVTSAQQWITAIGQVGGYEKMDYLKKGETCFITMPLHHSYGLSSLLEYTMNGFTVFLPKDASILSAIGPLLDKGVAPRIDSIEGVPFFYEQLSRFFKRTKLTTLKHIGMGADHVSKELLGLYQANYSQVNFTVRYGLTEIPSVICVQSFYTVDKYIPFMIADWLPAYHLYLKEEEKGDQERQEEKSVREPQGEKSDQEVQGELCIRYAKDPGSPGITTGDIVTQQGDVFFLKGRKAAIFKYKGMKVNPLDIEQVLEKLPSVIGALVYLDEKAVLNADILVESDFSRTTLIMKLTVELPAYMIPARINVVDQLPRTPTGKLIRRRDPAPPGSIQ